MESGRVPASSIDDDGGYVDDIHIGAWAATGDPSMRMATEPRAPASSPPPGTEPVVGVAPQVRLMALKAYYVDEEGNHHLPVSALVECIDYAIQHGARIANNSYGISETEPLLLREAFQRASEAGLLMVTSAGNAGTDTDLTPHYPSGWCISLGNVVSVGLRGWTTCRRPTQTTGHQRQPVRSWKFDLLHTPQGTWGFKSGTRCSSPGWPP